MRLGARGQRGWGARTAVERWRASLALGVRQAVQLSAPRQTAFGSGVSVGDCRFSSPGVAASPHNVLKFFGYCNDFDREVRKCLRNEDLSLSPKLECSRVIVTHGSLQLK
ncbi:COX assembly mitochondrial protein 2 homolog isoform X2 [Trachypithecus francoisi]|uniref:COX assembly mitochondrial protein 2 homolog isoform X2 n=1 Tax=Trachypithecus francoisi TaxID=54180 RepID=UPI00141AC363|nr:COX assembly mitochondrial protein 2 homolog isoform X2 [Trachypithecus francoisi]